MGRGFYPYTRGLKGGIVLSIYKSIKQYLTYIPCSHGELGMKSCSSCSAYIYVQEDMLGDKTDKDKRFLLQL
jgi:hypothetical protein